MRINKYIGDYENNSNILLYQSICYLLIIPVLYIVFYNFINLDFRSEWLINKINNPTHYNFIQKNHLDISYSISWLVLVVNFFIILILFSTNKFVKIKQARITKYFLPIYSLIWPILKVSILLVILIFIFTIFFIFNNILPFFRPPWLYFSLILASAYGSLNAFSIIINIIYKFDKDRPLEISGYSVSEKEQPLLFDLVLKCSKKVNSIFPQNIILGNTKGFFVASCNIKVRNSLGIKIYKGDTLYIPLISLKVLTKDELTGIIGHELAHFSGEDTIYSMKIKPIIYALGTKLLSIQKGFDENIKEKGFFFINFGKGLSKFFLYMVLNPITFIFINLKLKDIKICRNQEIRADKIGAGICKNPKSLITGLCKFYLYEYIWKEIQEDIKSQHTKTTLTKKFNLNLKKYFKKFNLKEDLKNIFIYEMDHPTDEHPPLRSRAKNLKIRESDIKKSDLTKVSPSASELIKNYDKLDKELTKIFL